MVTHWWRLTTLNFSMQKRCIIALSRQGVDEDYHTVNKLFFCLRAGRHSIYFAVDSYLFTLTRASLFLFEKSVLSLLSLLLKHLARRFERVRLESSTWPEIGVCFIIILRTVV